MRYLKALLLLVMLPSLALAQTAVLRPAANPPVPISILSQSAIPFIKASSGTMGNNCAISAMTALPRTFSGGAYIYLPAGAIAAGVPASADWYWFVGSSTTAGTCYNQTYANNKDANGTPRIPTANTAFATTGPGAFTGVTTAVTGPSITLPANSLGPNGRIEVQAQSAFTNNANNKNIQVLLIGSSCYDGTFTTHTALIITCYVANRGVTNVQSSGFLALTNNTSHGLGSNAADLAVDTTADVAINFKITNSVATDNASWETYRITVMRGN